MIMAMAMFMAMVRVRLFTSCNLEWIWRNSDCVRVTDEVVSIEINYGPWG